MKKTEDETARERVERGAALLTERLPRWFWDVDPERLEMLNACRCVIGQIGQKRVNLDALGDFDAAVRSDLYTSEIPYAWILRRLGKYRHPLNDRSHGFTTWNEQQVSFEALHRAWVAKIYELRAADAEHVS